MSWLGMFISVTINEVGATSFDLCIRRRASDVPASFGAGAPRPPLAATNCCGYVEVSPAFRERRAGGATPAPPWRLLLAAGIVDRCRPQRFLLVLPRRPFSYLRYARGSMPNRLNQRCTCVLAFPIASAARVTFPEYSVMYCTSSDFRRASPCESWSVRRVDCERLRSPARRRPPFTGTITMRPRLERACATSKH
jgi:hypothetical protein